MSGHVGRTERGVRLICGVGLLGTVWLTNFPSWGIAIISVIWGIALVTGAGGYCPAWSLLGVNTCQPQVAVKRQDKKNDVRKFHSRMDTNLIIRTFRTGFFSFASYQEEQSLMT